MKKKTDVNELEVGMYVAELDRPWRDTPFLFQGFEIRDADEIAELRRLCKFVYVLTESPEGRAASKRKPPVTAPERTSAESSTPSNFSIPILNQLHPREHAGVTRYRDQTTLGAEVQQAKGIERETKTALYNILDDARMGRSIDTNSAKQAVSQIVHSIIRNPDALVCLNQLKKKDEYTATHSLRVCVLALVFGRHLDFSVEQLNVLGIGALLHDIGKMRVPNEILNKPGRLTNEEFELMKTHVPHGVEILQKSKGILAASIDVARSHHERYDGSGYAIGSRADKIGLFGQIGAIADFYDAITSDRAYHSGMSAHDALRKLYELRDKDFHSTMAEQFIQCMGIYPIGSLVELNTGDVGVVISINRERRLKPCIALVLNSDKRPLDKRKILDLMHLPDLAPNSPVEIKTVLPSGTYGISPVHHLPFGR